MDQGLEKIPSPPVRDIGDLQRILETIGDWMFTILLVLATIFVIIAAYKYLIGSTNPEEIKKAHKMLIYTAVALIVAFLARAISFLVQQLLFGGTLIITG